MKKTAVKKTHAPSTIFNPAYDWDDNDPIIKAPKAGLSRKMQLEEHTLSSPILSSANKRKECPHYHSNMKASEPRMFIRFPYKASLMTLLRKVETSPTDIAALQFSAADYPYVYAGFQNHWYPSNNVPVLSLVAACNTIIQPPIVTRQTFEEATVTFMVSTSKHQHLVKFALPLIQMIDNAKDRIVLEVASAMDLDDHLITYVVHAEKEPLLMIKMWNLSSMGCRKLHLNAVYQAPRLKITDEVHILGLSGERTTTFKINFPYLRSSMMEMLEELDLQAIGFRTKRDTRPVFCKEQFENLPSPIDHNLLTRMTPQRATYRHPNDHRYVVMPSRITFYKGAHPVKPFFYPPPIHHKPGMPYGNVKPVLFPAGFQTYRNLMLDNFETVKDVVRDLAFNQGHEVFDEGMKILAETFGLNKGVIKENIHMPIGEFLKKHENIRYKRRNVPYVIRSPIKDIMPDTWYHSTKHPSISHNYDRLKVIPEGEEPHGMDPDYDNTFGHTPVSDIDLELIEPTIIEPDFWFPDEDDDDDTTVIEDKNENLVPPGEEDPLDLTMATASKQPVTTMAIVEDLANQADALDRIMAASPDQPPRKQVKRTHPFSDSRLNTSPERRTQLAERRKQLKPLHLPPLSEIGFAPITPEPEPEPEPMPEADTQREPVASLNDPSVSAEKEENAKKTKKNTIKSIVKADKEIIERLQRHIDQRFRNDN